jgi:hypothetical protein
VLAGGTLVLVLLAGGFWYLSRPLSPPRITAYTQVTPDGRGKDLGGTDGSQLHFTLASPLGLAGT